MEIEKHVPAKKRIRSNMDRLRTRLEVLENILLKFMETFKTDYYQNEYGQLLYAYLSWTKQQLNNLDDFKSNNKYFMQHLSTFELKIRYLLNKMNHQHLIKNKKVIKLCILNQPQLHYGSFLQHGIQVYINVLDIYGIWIKPNNIISLIQSQEPLSFVFIALLSRYTLNKQYPEYRHIYGNALKSIKNSIPKMYENNNKNNVTALALMAYLMLSHSKINLVSRYFSLAIRMAQSLDLQDIQEQKGNMIVGLSLFYSIISSLGIQLPRFQFLSQDFEFNLPSQHNALVVHNYNIKLPELRIESFLSTGGGNQLTKIFFKINAYAQQVKAKFNLQEIKNINNQELRLPSNEFNLIVTQLLRFNQGKVDNEVFEYNSIYFNIMYQLQLIHLYYPMILVYPKPVKFDKIEIKLLLNAANQFFLEFNKLMKSQEDSLNIEQLIQQTTIDQPKVSFPHYLQTFSCIIVFLNCLDKNNHYQLKIEDQLKCQHNCWKMCQKLYFTYKSSRMKNNHPAYFVLNKVKKVLYRFELNQQFLKGIEKYLKH